MIAILRMTISGAATRNCMRRISWQSVQENRTRGGLMAQPRQPDIINPRDPWLIAPAALLAMPMGLQVRQESQLRQVRARLPDRSGTRQKALPIAAAIVFATRQERHGNTRKALLRAAATR